MGISSVVIAETVHGTGYQVNVHINNHVSLPLSFLRDSQQVATSLFAEIGVHLKWAAPRKRSIQLFDSNCANESPIRDLAVEIVPHAPGNLNRSTLATALLQAESGARIVIFYDHVAAVPHGPQSMILGYVLAHEIGHVLQGTTRHTNAGIMRERWLDEDFKLMRVGLLGFSSEDARSISEQAARSSVSSRCEQTFGSY
jgi:hypothetical protein